MRPRARARRPQVRRVRGSVRRSDFLSAVSPCETANAGERPSGDSSHVPGDGPSGRNSVDTSPFPGMLIDRDVDSHHRPGDKKSMPHPDRPTRVFTPPICPSESPFISPNSGAVAQIACSPPPAPLGWYGSKYSDPTDLGGGYSLFSCGAPVHVILHFDECAYHLSS